ncbi:glycosyltransferase family 2 protein [Megasphaera sp. An286]|uniref:glycosyltransferase family 2 protein n=1 Tax=Megasphaera sp. An286 TaxID=1965622 RepID=UPI000B3BB9F6|nr:glycosyltransferase family 2 protein [Megasphaera sp. An286]OUO45672.1 hypothetical protein B5F80_07985 [Megasphaera sp. An286]
MPKISVIVPVYNVASYLKECIDSLLSQIFNDIEIILVDDGSTDESGYICDQYAQKDARIKVIHKRNGGLSDARNAGLDICRGEFIGFVDSDDYVDNDMYEILYRNAVKYKADISMCCDRRVPYQAGDYDFKGNKVSVWESKEEMIRQIFLARRTAVAVCLKIFHRNIFRQTRFPVGMTMEDAYIVLDTLRDCQLLVFQDVSKYNYRRRKGSIVQRTAYTDKILDLVYVYERNYNIIKKEYPALESVGEYRLFWALRETLARIGATTDYQEHENVIAQLQQRIKRDLKRLWANPYMDARQKAATILAMISCRGVAKLKHYV